MRAPRFKLRTLFIVTGVLGLIFLASVKVPVRETHFRRFPALGPAKAQYPYETRRRATVLEMATRAAVASAAVLGSLALVRTVRWSKTPSPASERLFASPAGSLPQDTASRTTAGRSLVRA